MSENNPIPVLDHDGLTYYDERVKTYINEVIEKDLTPVQERLRKIVEGD